MSSVKNPNFVDPTDAKIATYENLLQNYFSSLDNDIESVTFDELRAYFGVTRNQFSDPEVEYVLKKLGYEVI
jgi:hypothetical protein